VLHRDDLPSSRTVRTGAAALVALVSVCLLFAPLAHGLAARDPGTAVPDTCAADSTAAPIPVPEVALEDILASYNENIRRAFDSIDSLHVVQDMFEPQPDGTQKTARAILTYTRAGGMVRDEVRSELEYPAGNYTLRSLIGPTLEPSEYLIELEDTEEAEGHDCYRLSLEAAVRDVDHIDGTIWISSQHLTPVRIVAEVSDPPFPITEIKLDKSFAPEPSGLWFVRRHSGEGEANLLLVRRRGVRHIFYDDYLVTITDVRSTESLE
jgi:hypothetical protein